jgi:hypothetical protein
MMHLVGDDHEVEFHEIEIAIFHEIEIMIMRSKLQFFMSSKLRSLDRKLS